MFSRSRLLLASASLYFFSALSSRFSRIWICFAIAWLFSRDALMPPIFCRCSQIFLCMISICRSSSCASARGASGDVREQPGTHADDACARDRCPPLSHSAPDPFCFARVISTAGAGRTSIRLFSSSILRVYMSPVSCSLAICACADTLSYSFACFRSTCSSSLSCSLSFFSLSIVALCGAREQRARKDECRRSGQRRRRALRQRSGAAPHRCFRRCCWLSSENDLWSPSTERYFFWRSARSLSTLSSPIGAMAQAGGGRAVRAPGASGMERRRSAKGPNREPLLLGELVLVGRRAERVDSKVSGVLVRQTHKKKRGDGAARCQHGHRSRAPPCQSAECVRRAGTSAHEEAAAQQQEEGGADTHTERRSSPAAHRGPVFAGPRSGEGPQRCAPASG